jgi:hypothetical protein
MALRDNDVTGPGVPSDNCLDELPIEAPMPPGCCINYTVSQINASRERFANFRWNERTTAGCPPGLTQELCMGDDDLSCSFVADDEESHCDVTQQSTPAAKKIGMYEKFISVFKETASVWDEVPTDTTNVFQRMDDFFTGLINEGLAIKASGSGPAGAKVSSHLPLSSKLTTHGVTGRSKKRRQLG